MEVTNIPSTEPKVMDSDVQESTALWRKGVATELDGNTVRSAEVTFRPGERTKFHTHAGVQILHVTGGSGVVATREERRTVTEGDMIMFPPGEEHWHGTDTDAESPFSHVYFIVEAAGSTTTVAE
jgi:quercetin dioxygenase-like cupin family protein